MVMQVEARIYGRFDVDLGVRKAEENGLDSQRGSWTNIAKGYSVVLRSSECLMVMGMEVYSAILPHHYILNGRLGCPPRRSYTLE